MIKLATLAAAALALSGGGALAQTYSMPGSYPMNAVTVGSTAVPGLGRGAVATPRSDVDVIETGSIRAHDWNAAKSRAR